MVCLALSASLKHPPRLRRLTTTFMLLMAIGSGWHSCHALLSSRLGGSVKQSSSRRGWLLQRALSATGGRDETTNQADDDSVRLHQVQWQTSQGTVSFQARHGETLRSAALRQGVASPHNGRANWINCRGLGTCGTCAVFIEPSGHVEPKERNAIERTRLSLPPHGELSVDLRLACQVQVRGDLVVTKRTGFWGHKGGVADLSEPTRPFGELEYLLDRNK